MVKRRLKERNRSQQTTDLDIRTGHIGLREHLAATGAKEGKKERKKRKNEADCSSQGKKVISLPGQRKARRKRRGDLDNKGKYKQ